MISFKETNLEELKDKPVWKSLQPIPGYTPNNLVNIVFNG